VAGRRVVTAGALRATAGGHARVRGGAAGAWSGAGRTRTRQWTACGGLGTRHAIRRTRIEHNKEADESVRKAALEPAMARAV
jgi:hypothetical protein